MNAFEIDPAYSGQADIARDRADIGLKCDERRDPLDFLPNRVGRLQTICSPPDILFLDLLIRERTDYDSERLAHSRRRRSARTVSIGMPSPRSHCAIDSRSIRSVSGSASNVSSSGKRTVTVAPSGSSAS